MICVCVWENGPWSELEMTGPRPNLTVRQQDTHTQIKHTCIFKKKYYNKYNFLKQFSFPYNLHLMFSLKYNLECSNNSSYITNVRAFTCFFFLSGFVFWICVLSHLFLQLLKPFNFVPTDNTHTLTDTEIWRTGRNSMSSFRPLFKETHTPVCLVHRDGLPALYQLFNLRDPIILSRDLWSQLLHFVIQHFGLTNTIFPSSQ